MTTPPTMSPTAPPTAPPTASPALAAATDLVALLDQENAALAALDLRAAAALLDRKRDAAERLDRARRTPSPYKSPPAGLDAALARLRDLGARNKLLLERAMLVQERVLGVVVRAATPAQPPRYGARGTVTARTGGYALAASA